MIEVYVRKQVPRNCSTCGYNSPPGCCHFDRRFDWIKYWLLGGLKKCPSASGFR